MKRETDIPQLKSWITKQLEQISDADSDILSEYVVALLQHDVPHDELRALCISQLEDFLHANTAGFVDSLLSAVDTGSYLEAQLPQQAEGSSQGQSIEIIGSQPSIDSEGSSNKVDSYDPHFPATGTENNTSTPFQGQQQFRNNFRNNRGFNKPRDNDRRNGSNSGNPNRPFQSVGPGQEQMWSNGMPLPSNQGFIPIGNGETPLPFPPMIFDANGTPQMFNPMFSPDMFSQGAGAQGGGRFRGTGDGKFRGGRRGGRGGRGDFNNGGKSDISSIRNDSEYSNRKLVVEKIPDDKLNEADLLEYFSKFGPLKVKINPKQRLAELEFERIDQAQAAWASPEPIFGNRFVKVYWRKIDENENENEEPKIDVEGVKLIQAEKQKAYEEKTARKQAVDSAMKEIMQKKMALIQQQKEQQMKLLQLAEKSNSAEPETDEKKEYTDKLRAQLAELQEEASNLGIKMGYGKPDHNQFKSPGYRSRGGYHPYGSRGGGYRGRGGGKFAPSARSNLDLRPKSVEVGPIPSEKEEAFRGYLLSIGEHENVERSAPDTLVVSFNDRRTAEQFFYGPKSIPDVGEISKKWKSAALSTTPASSGESNDVEMN